MRALATDGPAVLFTPAPVASIKGLEVQFEAPIRQMIFVGVAEPFKPAFDALRAEDAPAMLELTALTKPGPFFARTLELGQYFGVRDNNRLVAMAGERTRFDGLSEISAVCVHPDHRGKGYAQRLIRALIKAIADRGETPFLHVFASNANAIGLYERLGFVVRATMQVTALQRGAALAADD